MALSPSKITNANSGTNNPLEGQAQAVSPATFAMPIRTASHPRSDTAASVISCNQNTVPANTPASKSVAGDFIDLGQPIDCLKLRSSLGIIEEHHNDAIHLDLCPPPTNPGATPFTSPPASQYAYPIRDIPAVNRRLELIGEHASHPGSPASVSPPASEAEYIDMSDGTIHIALGSPRARAPLNDLDSRLFRISLPSPLKPDKPRNRSIDLKGDVATLSKVFEHQDWAGAVLEDVDQALARLENLAMDDHQKDGSKSVEQHYRARLIQAVSKSGRVNPFTEEERSSSVAVAVSTGPEMGVSLVTSSTFNVLKERVSGLEGAVAEMSRELAELRKK